MGRRGLVNDLSQKVLETGDDLRIRREIGVHDAAVKACQLGGCVTERGG